MIAFIDEELLAAASNPRDSTTSETSTDSSDGPSTGPGSLEIGSGNGSMGAADMN